MSTAEFDPATLETIDLEASYQGYLSRFEKTCGDKPIGSFAKFGRYMITKLSRGDFEPRLEAYLRARHACTSMLAAGTTINDTFVMDFEEAAAWICIKAPNVLGMFRGELGELPDASPLKSR